MVQSRIPAGVQAAQHGAEGRHVPGMPGFADFVSDVDGWTSQAARLPGCKPDLLSHPVARPFVVVGGISYQWLPHGPPVRPFTAAIRGRRGPRRRG
jgi:hypothetical protein